MDDDPEVEVGHLCSDSGVQLCDSVLTSAVSHGSEDLSFWPDTVDNVVYEETVEADSISMLSSDISSTEPSNIGQRTRLSFSEDSVGVEDSLHFSGGRAMNTVTQLISHETRPSFQHVNQIIKQGAKAIKAIAPRVLQKSPTCLGKKSNRIVKKVIVIQPWDDPEQVTADAIHNITENLNKEAAQHLAAGRTPDKETVIEITRLQPPAEQNLSPGTLNKVRFDKLQQSTSEQQRHSSMSPPPHVIVSPEKRHHRRKSPHPKRYMYHTPSPPHAKSHSARSLQNLSAGCYFQGKSQKMVSVSHTSASRKLLGMNLSASQTFSSTTQSAPSASRLLATQKHPRILRVARQSSHGHSITSTKHMSTDSASVRLTIQTDSTAADREVERAMSRGVSISLLREMCTTNDQQTKDESSKMNESLTNIQWLGSMSGDSLDNPSPANTHHDARMIASDRQIEQISRECGRKKRPPYSYMHLIQMAICSKDDKKMTLKEIYKWIEEKFPFYKFCPNQGWKNSIRHNLSLYDIFVREKTSTGMAKNGSNWTLREDIPLKTAARSLQNLLSNKSDKSQNNSQESTDSGYSSQPSLQPIYIIGESPSVSPACLTPQSVSISSKPATPILAPVTSLLTQTSQPSHHQPSGSKKKGPVPLLPKPAPVQTYALIPIQSGVPVINPQPIMVSSAIQPKGAAYQPKIRPASASDLLLQRSVSVTAESRPQSSLAQLGNRPSSASDIVVSAKRKSACDLLSGEEVKPEGMITPPLPIDMMDTEMNRSLKRHHSPTELSGSSAHHKQARLSHHDSIPGAVTQGKKGRRKVATCTVTSATLIKNPEEQSMDTSDLNHQLAKIRFADSGFISDCSSYDHTASDSFIIPTGLPIPTMYIKQEDFPKECSSEVVLSLDNSSSVSEPILDFLSSIEKSLSTPMRHLLQTPTKPDDKSLFTSTPFKALGSPSWISPIKSLTPVAGDLKGSLFTPLKEGKTMTSTPYGTETDPGTKALGESTPPNDRRQTQYCFQGNLTPLKTPFKSPPASKDPRVGGEVSPGDLFSITNQSFTRMLGEVYLDSMIDEGINLDVSNMSFSALQ